MMKLRVAFRNFANVPKYLGLLDNDNKKLPFFEASKNVYSLENVNRHIFVYNFAL